LRHSGWRGGCDKQGGGDSGKAMEHRVLEVVGDWPSKPKKAPWSPAAPLRSKSWRP